MNKLTYKSYEVELKHKPKLKNTYISIEPNNKILIKSSSKSHTYIKSLLDSRETWIQKQFEKQESSINLELNLEDEILLFGQRQSIDTDEATYLREKLQRLRSYSKQKVIKCYDDFYQNLSADYLEERVKHFSQLMGLEFKVIKYRKMKSRWGSCSSIKTITFNTELMKLEKKMIDYVVVHELAHLQHMNHSKAFHELVEDYLPQSKQIRAKLKQVRLR